MTIEEGKVVIHAFHERDMEELFKSLGTWDAFKSGRMACVVCRAVLNDDNFGALLPYKGTVAGVCVRHIPDAYRLQAKEG